MLIDDVKKSLFQFHPEHKVSFIIHSAYQKENRLTDQ